MRLLRLKVAPNVKSASRALQKSDECKSTQDGCNNQVNQVADLKESDQGFLKCQPQISLSAGTPGFTTASTEETERAKVTNIFLSSIQASNPFSEKAQEINDIESSVALADTCVVNLDTYKHAQNDTPSVNPLNTKIKTKSKANNGSHGESRLHSTSDLESVTWKPDGPYETARSSTEIDNHCEAIEEEKLKKAKQFKRRGTALELKKEALRRKLSKGKIERSELTMFDLIYYNPVEPDKPPRIHEKLKMRPKPYEVSAQTVQQAREGVFEGMDVLEERLDEEEEIRRVETGEAGEQDEDLCEESLPVPQVCVGPNGEITLNDESLVIETTETKRNKRKMDSTPVIVENGSTLVNYGSWSKRPRSARWTLKETARFYKSLAMVGTNLSLMEKLLPTRSRLELKRKFKHEEKINGALVDKILATQIPFDRSQFSVNVKDKTELDLAKEDGSHAKKGQGEERSTTDMEEVED